MIPSKQQRSHGKKQADNEFIMYQQPPSIDYMHSLPSLSTVVSNDKVESNLVQQQMINPEHSFTSNTPNTNTTNTAVTPIPSQRSYTYSNDPNNDNNSRGLNTEEQHNLYNNQQHMIHNRNDIVGPSSLQQQVMQPQPIPKNNSESEGHQHINTPTSITMDNNSLRFYQRMEMFPQSPSTHTFYSSQSLQSTDPTTNNFNEQNTHEQQQYQEDHNKVYSFMPLESVFQQKRPRRKFNEIDRLYKCNYYNCTKAYGTLNHLNAHISMQEHGPKRLPIEFKELRKQLRKSKAEITAKNRNSIASTSSTEPQQQQQQQQQQRRTPSIDYQNTTAINNTNTRRLSNNEFNTRNTIESLQSNEGVHVDYSGTTSSNFSRNANDYNASSVSVPNINTAVATAPPIMNHSTYQYRSYQPQPQHTPIPANTQQQSYQRQFHIMQQHQQFH